MAGEIRAMGDFSLLKQIILGGFCRYEPVGHQAHIAFCLFVELPLACIFRIRRAVPHFWETAF